MSNDREFNNTNFKPESCKDINSDELMVKRRKIENEVMNSINCLDMGIKNSANKLNNKNKVNRSTKDSINLCSPGGHLKSDIQNNINNDNYEIMTPNNDRE